MVGRGGGLGGEGARWRGGGGVEKDPKKSKEEKNETDKRPGKPCESNTKKGREKKTNT